MSTTPPPPSTATTSGGGLLTIDGETKRWTLRKRKILGKGTFGMATLYEDVDTQELVVVKDLNLQCVKKASDVEAVHTEIQILKKTSSHPNIVHYLDSSFDGKFSMQILMEYCDGGDLADKIDEHSRKNQPLSEGEILSLFIQIMMGLHHLHHDHRILHRDLKPQNIFLRSDGVAKIGDFGVSTILSQNVEFAKTFCGSPYYLAPELCEEKRYNGKADIWSCGVMLYEMMALRRPFDGKNLITLITQITKADFPPVVDELPYSSAIRDLSYTMLQLQPENRPALKRILRSSLVTNGIKFLPSYCTTDKFYLDQFGKPASPMASVGGSGSKPRGRPAATEAQLLAEMEAWAANDKQNLQKTEVARGMKPSELVDSRYLDQTQLQLMQRTGSSSANNNQLVLTASADDDDWNHHYDDDEFEDDDEVMVESAPSVVPLVERSFRFAR